MYVFTFNGSAWRGTLLVYIEFHFRSSVALDLLELKLCCLALACSLSGINSSSFKASAHHYMLLFRNHNSKTIHPEDIVFLLVM